MGLLAVLCESKAVPVNINRAVVIFTYESRVQTAASQRATSRAFRDRLIGRADGPDRASRGSLRKPSYIFRKSTRAPDVLSDFFTKNASCYFQIDARSRTDAHWFVCKKDLHFIEIQPALHRHSHHFLRKHPLIFLK